jgi:AcrR family transcriptional regulator
MESSRMETSRMETSRMAKRGRPTANERAERRERILDAAAAAFGARGFGGASLDEVAAAAGVTKRTLYVDVGDKAALFAAAVEREHDRIRSVAERPGVHALHAVASEIVFVLHSDQAIALHRAMIADAPGFPELAERFYETGPEHSIAVLGRALGEVSPPDRAVALYALLLGERHRRRLLGLDPAPTRETAQDHAAACLALLALAP